MPVKDLAPRYPGLSPLARFHVERPEEAVAHPCSTWNSHLDTCRLSDAVDMSCLSGMAGCSYPRGLTRPRFQVDERCVRQIQAIHVTEHRSPSEPRSRPSSDLDQALREIDALSHEVNQLRHEVVWSDRLTTLGTMSAVLAHEYNNLLTPIGSYAQLALANPDDAELTEKALHAAVRGVEQAKAIAQATLGMARPGELEQDHAASLKQSLEHAVACIGPALHQDEIELCLSVPDLEVAMPAIQLQQVLINLIDNARKALSERHGSRKIVVAGKQEQGGVRIEVADNGPGIPEGMRERLFDAFATGRASETGQAGTGLGLRICKDLVASAGGWIAVKDAPDTPDKPGETCGATLIFWLPTTAEATEF